MEPTPEHEIYQVVRSYAKIYPAMTKLFVYGEARKVRISGFESRDGIVHSNHKGKNPLEKAMYYIDSLRRTKTRLSDIVISNKFDMFCTFTFNCEACPINQNGEKCANHPCICDPQKCTRFDVNFCKKRMSNWLDNQNQRVGHFKYLIVPEFHKDKRAIHFHALFKDYKGDITDSGRKDKGKTIYRIDNYHFGFADLKIIPEEDIERVGSYVKKYITKDMPQFKGKQRYWCSKNLIRPDKVANPVIFPGDEDKFKQEYEMRNNIKVKVANERIDLIGQ